MNSQRQRAHDRGTRLLRGTLLTVLWTAALCGVGVREAVAQSAAAERSVAYPQSARGSRTGHVVPFGRDASGRFDACRFQQLIPAAWLPAAGAQIHGIEIEGAAADGALSHERFELRLAVATAQALSTTFADNLGATKLVVASAPSSGWWLVDGGRLRIDFDQPFAMPADSPHGLVLEVRKRVAVDSAPQLAGVRTAGDQAIDFLPAARYAAGGIDSGADDAAMASRALAAPVEVRLLTTGSPTLRAGSARAGAAGRRFALGGTIDLEVQCAAGAPVVFVASPSVVGGGFRTPLLTGTGWIDLATLWNLQTGVSSADGGARLTLAIPHSPGLVGLPLTFQSIVLESPPSGGAPRLRWSTAVRARLTD